MRLVGERRATEGRGPAANGYWHECCSSVPRYDWHVRTRQLAVVAIDYVFYVLFSMFFLDEERCIKSLGRASPTEDASTFRVKSKLFHVKLTPP